MGEHVGENEVNRATVLGVGHFGRVKIDAAGTATFEGEAFAVLPIDATFTYGADCQAWKGDAPAEDEAVADRTMDFWPVKKVVAKTGAAYVYLSK